MQNETQNMDQMLDKFKQFLKTQGYKIKPDTKVCKFKKIHPDAIIPTYAHEWGDAGMDLFSIEDKVIAPGAAEMVKTGLQVELPENTEGQVRSKSGIAAKSKVFVLNSPGTIDESYRGEIGVILQNLGEEDYTVEKGKKIAQLVINEVVHVKTQEVKELSSTQRGEGGFGSTGLDNNAPQA